MALPDHHTKFGPALWTVGYKFSGTVMRELATHWTCTKICPSAMGRRRIFLKRRLFLQGSSLANLLMPIFINIPVQTTVPATFECTASAQPAWAPQKHSKAAEKKKKKRERMPFRALPKLPGVTDSHRTAPSFEVESLFLYLTSPFVDISTVGFAPLGRSEGISRFLISLMSV